MSAEPQGVAKRVLVTGAGGRTGGIVFDKLLKKEGYATRGMVRSEKVAIMGYVQALEGRVDSVVLY